MYMYDIDLVTFPTKSAALKMAIRMTGIHEWSLQEMISLSMPGNRHRVTQYASEILNMYGHTVRATAPRANAPPAVRKSKTIHR